MAGNLENIKPHQFQPGNEGGPGRPPSHAPTFLRKLSNAETAEEVERLIESGMRNPLIAAKIKALQSDDPDLANRAAEQTWDRVHGKPKQTIDHAGEVGVRVSLLELFKREAERA